MTDSSGFWARRKRKRRGSKTEDEKGAGRGGTLARRRRRRAKRRAKARTRRKPGRKDGETSPGDGELADKRRVVRALCKECAGRGEPHDQAPKKETMSLPRSAAQHARETLHGRTGEGRKETGVSAEMNYNVEEIRIRKEGQIEDWRRRRLYGTKT